MTKLINYIKILSVFSVITLGGVFATVGGGGGGGRGDRINERPLPVPEPSSYVLILTGGVTIVCFRFWNARKRNSGDLL
ncbi:MAG TPA: PEP-CTERM sorting domain-containing protein [Candidatus Wunengus sp. YC60]|uniref:PEP-CTERM sorting domain-containing protein n=1 Tax=Candidatus Wunengus sp. YC60 TaxID=3367697 RepID=UPI004029B5E4